MLSSLNWPLHVEKMMKQKQWILGGALFSGKPRIISSSRKSQHQTQQNTRIFQMYSMTDDWSGTWLEKHPVYVQKIRSVRSKKNLHRDGLSIMPVTRCHNHSTSWIFDWTGKRYWKYWGSIWVHHGPSISSFSGWMGKSQLTNSQRKMGKFRGKLELRLKNLRFPSIFPTMHWNWIMVTDGYNPVGKWCLNIDRSDRATPTSCTGTMAAMAPL